MKFYSENARSLAREYNSLNPDSLHKSWSHFIPDDPGMALDIGAGSGRDANWLAEKGWDVVAVEPCREFRELAEPDSHINVMWLDDKLPDLDTLRTAGHRFNMILLSAVWMHVAPTRRERAFCIISELLAPSGVLVITLRHSNNRQEKLDRGYYPMGSSELEQLAAQHELAQVYFTELDDYMGRTNVSWEVFVFRLS